MECVLVSVWELAGLPSLSIGQSSQLLFNVIIVSLENTIGLVGVALSLGSLKN